MRFLKASLLFPGLPQPGFALLERDLFSLLYYVSLALSATIGLAITWRYWGWLLKERE